MKDDIFAEIEYETQPNATVKYDVFRIADPEADPVRLRFYDMRGMASNNPYTWNEARLFYRQGKFMADFADDYDGKAGFSMFAPCYQRMGYERLRTYFTWRVLVRREEFAPIGLTYLYLYVYELLCNIGVSCPADGLTRLMAFWRAYRQAEPDLDNHIPAWLKDYHVYYDLPRDFGKFHSIPPARLGAY